MKDFIKLFEEMIPENIKKQWDERVAFQCSCCFTNYTFNEFNNLRHVWVDGDEKYGKTTVCGVCGKLFHNGKWQILSHKDVYLIYTTHLEMPQCPPNFTESIADSEYFWETMIQNKETGKFLGFQTRYKTKEDAIDGHWLAYDQLENMLLYPEKYPQGIVEMFCNAMEQASATKKMYSEETKRKAN